MLLLNFSNEKLNEIGKYIKYLDVEGEFKVSNPSEDSWIDLINNNLEKKICYCFENDKYKDEDLNGLISKINPDIYQNLEKSIIFISDKPFEELPPHNSLPCFLFTNLINDYTIEGNQKYLHGDDYYFQFIALLNIIKDNHNDFIGGNYYGITNAGLFKEQVNEISAILNDVVSKILDDKDVKKNDLLYNDFISLKNSVESQIKSFPQETSFERVFKFSKETVLSQIRSTIGNLWEGKLLENILINNLKKPKVNFDEGFIGQIGQKLINTLKKLSYYPRSFIIDYERQAKKDLSEIEPIIDEFNNNVYLRFLDKEKRFYISIGIWFIISALLIYLIPTNYTFGFILIALILLLVFFYLLPRMEFKKDLNDFYKSIENQIRLKNKKYIDSNLEWTIAYVRTLVEEYIEDINPKYREVLDFMDNIPPYKIYNFNYNYWSEVNINNLDIKNSISELANSLNQQILKQEKKYLTKLLTEFEKTINSNISDSHNNTDQFWDNTTAILATMINKLSHCLASKNLLKIINPDKIKILSQNYSLFVPEHIKASIPLSFTIQDRKYLKTKSFIILSWIETYSNKIT